jgi:large subunit ribosomal protein L4
MKLPVKTLDGQDAGEIEVADAIFGIPEIRRDLIHQVVNYQRAARRGGTHKVKQRGEITGTGKKPWKQKGTGRARAGDLKRPQDRGGGVAHGPRVRSHAFALNKKVRSLALRHALSAKVAGGYVLVLDTAAADTHKTKPMAAALAKLGLTSALIVAGPEVDTNFARATANIPRIDVLPAQGANVYDILRRNTLVLTRDAVAALTERLAA